MNDVITTLHPINDEGTNLYPNIKKENIPNLSINYDRLDNDVRSLLSNIGTLRPSGTDTSTNILTFNTDKGIYVATDNGHWYYWNGSHYVDGGVYQATIFTAKTEVTLEIMQYGYMCNYHNGIARIESDNNWKVSKPVFIKGGTKIEFVNNGYTSDIITLISSKRVEGNIYTPIDRFFGVLATTDGRNDQEVHTFFTTEADGYYYFCDRVNEVATAWHLYIYDKKEYSPSDDIDISLFQTIGVIGDSYSSGELQLVNDQDERIAWRDLNEISWPQILGRDKGVNVTNYTQGGVNFKTWKTYFLDQFINDTKKDLYIIALGLNEVNSTLGTYQDATQTPFADTIYGHISELLTDLILNVDVNKTKFIISTIMPNPETNSFFPVTKLNQINNAIEEVAGRYNIPVIYQKEDEYFKSDYFCKYMTYAHPNAVSYSGMSKAYERMIKNCLVYHKEDYFKDLFVYKVSE